MSTYDGEIHLSCDGSNNIGAVASLLAYIRKCIIKGKFDESDEYHNRKKLMSIGISRMSTPYDLRMTLNNFEFGHPLISGKFGSVWKATGKEGGPGGDYTIKQQLVTIQSIPVIWKERDVLILLKNKFINRIVGAFYDVDAFFVMELCYGCVTELKERISTKNALRFSFHLLEAVRWIHNNNVVHSAITPDNCLVNSFNRLVLSDFSSCILLLQEEEYVITPVDQRNPGYLDLEALENLKFSKDTDIFSAACVIYEMVEDLYLLYVLGEPKHLSFYIGIHRNGQYSNHTGKVETITDRVMESELANLLLKMTSATNRYSAADALASECFQDVLSKHMDFPNDINDVCEAEFVTMEVTQNKRKHFKIFGDAKAEVDPSLIPLYYDEILNNSALGSCQNTIISDNTESSSNAPFRTLSLPSVTSQESDERTFEQRKLLRVRKRLRKRANNSDLTLISESAASEFHSSFQPHEGLSQAKDLDDV